jgi:dipeptidyl aminopeptidase/acylaminoacyl peptidase
VTHAFLFRALALAVIVPATLVAQASRPAPAAGTSAARRAMSIDDLLAVVRVSDPQISPDGKSVLYTRTATDLTTGRRNSDIYIVDAGGGPPQPFIATDKNESGIQFSAGRKRGVFISNRDGAPQVYLVGGAATRAEGGQKITDAPLGVQTPLVISADGSKIAYVSDVYPECADLQCTKKKAEEAEKNPVKAYRLTRLLFRHWAEWRYNIRHHVFVTDVESGKTVDVTPGDFDSPPYFQEDAGIAFSPDGREIAFVSNREGTDREAWTTNNDVWLVLVTGGQAKKLTNNPAADVNPLFSPDGRTVFVRAQRRPGFESDRWYIDAYDRSTGAKKTLFDTPDLSVESLTLSKDGKTVYFGAQQEGREHLFSIAAGGGTPKRLVEGGVVSSAVEADGVVAFLKSTLTAPSEVFRASADGSDMKPLTRENASWLDEVQFQEPESLTATGAGGAKIQYWLIKPPNFDASKKYPVVFLIHGGPQGAWLDSWSHRWNPSLWAAQGWVIAAPNPRGSTGFGQKFLDEISGDWGGKVMTDLDAVFDAVAKMPFTDSTRMGIAGASYGGYAVNWIIGHTDRFRAAVSHDGVWNLESMSMATEELWFTEWEFGGPPWSPKARAQFAKWSPHLSADRIKTPTLIITNELDYRVPVDQGLQMLTALRRNGVPAEALVFPDEGHWVLKALNSKAWHEAVFGWMTKYLGQPGSTATR